MTKLQNFRNVETAELLIREMLTKMHFADLLCFEGNRFVFLAFLSIYNTLVQCCDLVVMICKLFLLSIVANLTALLIDYKYILFFMYVMCL